MRTSLYRFYDATSQLLYIGITNSVPRRFDQHDSDKPWYADVARVTIEHHPDRSAALAAEKAAIKAERPKYNVVHNHGRREKAASRQGKWTFRSRESGVSWRTDLWLYPELDCSAMVENVDYLDGEGQLEEYVQYLKRKYPEWLESDAVPIYWTVRGRQIYESAPFQRLEDVAREDFLSCFTWPEDARTGEPLDWYRLPVVNDRFPEFAAALAWTPSPLEPTCPLRSILASRAQRWARHERKSA